MFKAVSTNAKLLTSCLQSILIKKDAVSQHISAALAQVLLLAALILIPVRICLALSAGH
jgi:hypothetical protein